MNLLFRTVITVVLSDKTARFALLLTFTGVLWPAAVQAAPRIDSVNRSTICDGQGVDFSPFAEDDQADNDSSPLAGTFTGRAAVPISLNDNAALFEADQVSAVNLADLTFSGNGSAHIDQDGRFDANDAAGGAFFQGASGSSLTVFFTLGNSGKISLSTTLAATRSFSSGVAPSAVSIAAHIEIKRGTTVIWSRYTDNGTLTFSGDVALAAGQYQLTVSTGSNVSLNAAGAQFAETTGSFSVNGKISENASSGGGKKGGR